MAIKKGSKVVVTKSGKLYSAYWELANQFIAEDPSLKWLEGKSIANGLKSKVLGIKHHVKEQGVFVAAIVIENQYKQPIGFVLIGVDGLTEDTPPKRGTNRQLAEWLSQGRGLVKVNSYIVAGGIGYEFCDDCEPIAKNITIRKIGVNEWLEPTVENLM